MFSFSYYTLASFAITRESGITGTEIWPLNIGAVIIDVTDGMRGGAFIDIWISKIIEWIDTYHLREEIWIPKSWILFFGVLESGIRENFACGIRNPEIWNPKYSSMESGIPQEEISLPFVTVKRKEKWVILESRIHCVEFRIQQECKPFQYFKKKKTIWF